MTQSSALNATQTPATINTTAYASVLQNVYVRLAVLTVILLIAATRILNIDGPSLWIDEGFTWYTFRGDLFKLVRGDRHPPFYFYSLHAWSALTGESVLALRFWSFLPSMISVAVVYQIGLELWRERLWRERTATAQLTVLSIPVLAALMMALADGENYLAQELRMYTWQVLWCASATWFYLRWSRTFNRRDGALWWLFMTLALYTHYFSIYVIVAHGIHALLYLRKRQRLFAVGIIGLVGVAFLPWFLAVMRDQFFDSDVCVNCGSAIDLEKLDLFRQSWFGNMWIFTLGLALFGLITVRYRDNIAKVRWLPTRGTVLVAFLGVLPLLLTYLLSHRQLVFFNQHFAQLTIPVVLLLALGLGNIQRSARAVLVLILVLYGVTHVDWYRQKAPWEQVVDTFDQYVQRDHLALVEVGAENAATWYYVEHMLPDGVTIGLNPWWGNIENPEFYQETLPALIANQPDVQDDVVTAWLIHWNASQTMFDYLTQFGYVPTMQTTVYHVDEVALNSYRYDQLPDSSVTTFENGLILRAFEFDTDDLRVDLWWSAESVPAQDAVTSVLIFDADDNLVAQGDSQPQNGVRPTTTFTVGEAVYDPKSLTLSEGIATLNAGTYRVAMQVYRFTLEGDIQIIPNIDGQERVMLGEFSVE